MLVSSTIVGIGVLDYFDVAKSNVIWSFAEIVRTSIFRVLGRGIQFFHVGNPVCFYVFNFNDSEGMCQLKGKHIKIKLLLSPFLCSSLARLYLLDQSEQYVLDSIKEERRYLFSPASELLFKILVGFIEWQVSRIPLLDAFMWRGCTFLWSKHRHRAESH